MINKLKQFLSVLKFRDNAFIRLARCKDIDAESILPMAEETISHVREEERNEMLGSLPKRMNIEMTDFDAGGNSSNEVFNDGYNTCLAEITKLIKE